MRVDRVGLLSEQGSDGGPFRLEINLISVKDKNRVKG